jgi:hypothetical protein
MNTLITSGYGLGQQLSIFRFIASTWDWLSWETWGKKMKKAMQRLKLKGEAKTNHWFPVDSQH